jgi:hypothetical protein
VFSPVSHTYWLAKHINTAQLEVERGMAHFRSVEVLPRILAWVADTADREQQANPLPAMAVASTAP